LLSELDGARRAGIEARVRADVAAAGAEVADDRAVHRTADDLVAFDIALGDRGLEPADAVVLRQRPEDGEGQARLAEVAVEIEPEAEALRRHLGRGGDLLAGIPPGPALELVTGVAERGRVADLLGEHVRRKVDRPVGEGNAAAHRAAHEGVGGHAERLAHGVEAGHLHPAVPCRMQRFHGVAADPGR